MKFVKFHILSKAQPCNLAGLRYNETMKKKIILFLFLFLTAWPAGATDFFNDEYLITYYRLEGDGADEKNNNNGTVNQTVDFSSDHGKFGQGATFVTDYAGISASGLNLDSAWSASVWFTIVERGFYQNIIAKRTGTRTFQLSNQYPNNERVIRLHNWQSANIDSSVLATSTWHLAVITSSGASQACLYIDGSLVNCSTSFNFISQSNNGNLVGNYDGGTTQWSGNVDDVAFFNRVLSSDEIEELWNNGTGLEIYASATSTPPEPEATTSTSTLPNSDTNTSYLVGIATIFLVIFLVDFGRRNWAGYVK